MRTGGCLDLYQGSTISIFHFMPSASGRGDVADPSRPIPTSNARGIAADPGMVFCACNSRHHDSEFQSSAKYLNREASYIPSTHYPLHEFNPPLPILTHSFTMAGVAYYSIAGKQVGGHYVSSP